MSAGILLSRLVGGALADAFGWRGMLLVFAGLVLLCAAGAWLRLPRSGPHPPAATSTRSRRRRPCCAAIAPCAAPP
ncbi:MFS transporter [Streptomyces sp. Q6]|uniref:MFS transporter n=1 Tax=Streptomyces citrinus TaxID=3118173 RepID=A0ACD5A690_9ACTN